MRSLSLSWLLIPMGSLLGALALHASCGGLGWGPGGRHPYCYTDLIPLYLARGLGSRAVPYLEAPFEYPVATGFVAYATALISPSPQLFFVVNSAILGGCAVVVSACLHRLTGSRFLYFAAAPSLILYFVLNWDLVPVALATTATYALLTRREVRSGVLLGLGAAAKIFPGLFSVPFSLWRSQSGDRVGAKRLLWATGGTWALANLPVALVAYSGWSWFYRFSSSRPPTWGTIWSVACRWIWGRTWCPHVELFNAISLVAFAGLTATIWFVLLRTAPAEPRWTLSFPILVAFLLTNKVYSPQYSMWLLPWFALVLPRVLGFIAFEVADVAVFLTEFSAQGARFGLDPLPRWSLDLAVLLRAMVLMLLLFVFVRDAQAGMLSRRSDAILERLRSGSEGEQR